MSLMQPYVNETYDSRHSALPLRHWRFSAIGRQNLNCIDPLLDRHRIAAQDHRGL